MDRGGRAAGGVGRRHAGSLAGPALAGYHRRVIRRLPSLVLRPLGPRLVLPVLLGGLLAGSKAQAAPTVPMCDVVLHAGWRTSLDALDRAPGFQAAGAGGQIFVGLSWGGVGPVLGGRARAGAVKDQLFIEAAGDFGIQVQLGDRVRLRLGAEGGANYVAAESAWYVGGFLDGTFDVVQFGGGRVAVIFALRMDIDHYLTTSVTFPQLSTELGAGFGVRY